MVEDVDDLADFFLRGVGCEGWTGTEISFGASSSAISAGAWMVSGSGVAIVVSSTVSGSAGSESFDCAFLPEAEVSCTEGFVTLADLLLNERVFWLAVPALVACLRRVVGMLPVVN